jgi:hypothetical protein
MVYELQCDIAALLPLQSCCALSPTCGVSAPAFVRQLRSAQLLGLQVVTCVFDKCSIVLGCGVTTVV